MQSCHDHLQWTQALPVEQEPFEECADVVPDKYTVWTHLHLILYHYNNKSEIKVKLNYRIIVNTVQCDSISRYLLPCFGQLTISRRHKTNMFRNYYYEVRNTYVTFLYKKLFTYTITWIKILLISNISNLEPIRFVSMCLSC
jgi:hypothetical protein